MKSQLQESQLKTLCEKCTFAQYENGVQKGCAADRIQKFINNGSAFFNNEFYALTRFCNMYREEQQTVEEARKQIELTFAIVIYDNENASQLQKAIESIYLLNYNKDKFKIIISSSHNTQASYLFDIVHEFKKNAINSELIINLTNESIDYDAFVKSVGFSYIVKMNHSSAIDKNFLSYIDEEINDKLNRFIMIEDESENVLALPFWIVNKTYLDYNNFDLMVDAIRTETTKQNMYKKYER
jgi:hypothetical protein